MANYHYWAFSDPVPFRMLGGEAKQVEKVFENCCWEETAEKVILSKVGRKGEMKADTETNLGSSIGDTVGNNDNGSLKSMSL